MGNIFSGIAQVCQGLQPLGGSALVHGEEGGAPGTLGPQKFFKVPAPCVWNLSRNPRVCQGLQPLGGSALVHGEEGGAPGTLGPQKFFKVPAPCVWNLSRNPRVCLGFRLPRGKALVHGGGRFEIPVPYVTTRGPDSLGGKALVHGGGLGLGDPQIFSKSQLACATCPEMPGSAWGFRLPRGMALVPGEEGGGRGDLAPGLPIRGGRQEPVSENPKQVPDTRLLFARKAEVPSESRRRVR